MIHALLVRLIEQFFCYLHSCSEAVGEPLISLSETTFVGRFSSPSAASSSTVPMRVFFPASFGEAVGRGRVGGSVFLFVPCLVFCVCITPSLVEICLNLFCSWHYARYFNPHHD